MCCTCWLAICHQIVAVPHQRTYRAHLAIRPEGRMQQSHRMQMLDPLAFVKIGALARHVFHVPRIHQARLDAVLLQHVVHRNPVHSGGLHRCCGDATTDQPFGHLVQIAGEGLALADGMLIPVRRHGDVDLPGSNIDAGRMRLKHRMPRSFHLTGPLAAGHLRPRLCRPPSGCCFGLDIALSFRSGKRPSRAQEKYSFDRDQSEVVSQTVTTVWCTETWDHAPNRVCKTPLIIRPTSVA